MFMCYVIVMLCFMFCGDSGDQGDSAHSCYSDKGKGGRSTLVLNFLIRIEKRISMESFKELNDVVSKNDGSKSRLVF